MKRILMTGALLFPALFCFAQNVGIGTSIPAQKLDVIGNIRSSTLTGVGNRFVTADPTGTLNISSAGFLDSTFWKITGNDNTTPTTNFIGTLNARDFVTKTGGSAATNERVRVLSTGEVIVNNTSVGLNAGDVFSVYSNATTNGTTANISAIGAFAINGYSSGTGFGIYGENTGTGTGVFGNVTGGTALFGQSNSATGFGGFARNTNASGTGMIVTGNALAGTYLVNGSAASFTGNAFGTLAFSSVASAAVAGSAVWGCNRKVGILSFLGGAGVTGIDSALGSGVIGVSYNGGNEGVVGLGFSANGTGVFANANTGASQYGVWSVASATGGGTGNNSFGVFGDNTTGGTNSVGVIGQETAGGAATKFAVFANGDMGASGAKPFMIDHPLDPANKFLKHYAMESPEILNLYRGNVVLDANGEATVVLPDYFESINNTNYTYQLTGIGQPSIVYVKEEIQNKQFVIGGGQPGKKVSWVVMAERNDPYLQQNPQKREVVIQKTGDAIGKYLQPQLYGQPKEMGLYYKRTPDKSPVTEKSAAIDLKELDKLKKLNKQ